MKVTMDDSVSSVSVLFPSSMDSLKSVCVLFLFPLLFVASQAEVTGNILLPSCKTVGGGSTYFSVEFCMEALGSVGGGIDAQNYQDLAVVAVGLLTANATNTTARIDGLLREGGGKENVTTRCLRLCRALYDGMVQRQPGCSAAVKNGRFGEATSSLEKSAGAAKECEDGFGKSNAASPVTVEDENAFKLAKLAVALLRFA